MMEVTAREQKLFLNVFVLVSIVLDLLPEGRGGDNRRSRVRVIFGNTGSFSSRPVSMSVSGGEW